VEGTWWGGNQQTARFWTGFFLLLDGVSRGGGGLLLFATALAFLRECEIRERGVDTLVYQLLELALDWKTWSLKFSHLTGWRVDYTGGTLLWCLKVSLWRSCLFISSWKLFLVLLTNLRHGIFKNLFLLLDICHSLSYVFKHCYFGTDFFFLFGHWRLIWWILILDLSQPLLYFNIARLLFIGCNTFF
jgi:hypothetical protein